MSAESVSAKPPSSVCPKIFMAASIFVYELIYLFANGGSISKSPTDTWIGVLANTGLRWLKAPFLSALPAVFQSLGAISVTCAHKAASA